MREFNKEPNTLYFGLPSGGLRKKILEVFEKIGWPITTSEREYQFPSYKDPNLVFRVFKTRELPEMVRKGVVDFSIIGEDVLYETGIQEEVEYVGEKLPFSRKTSNPTRLVLAAKMGTYNCPDELRGKPLATEYPKLTCDKLVEVCGFNKDETILIPSQGKTEAKIDFGLADGITDLTETGETLRTNKFQELATLFESYPRMTANPEGVAIREFRERMEDIFFLMSSTLEAERNPQFMIRANCSKKDLERIMAVIPNAETANILPTSNGIVSIATLVAADQKKDLIPKLRRNGGVSIIAERITEIY